MAAVEKSLEERMCGHKRTYTKDAAKVALKRARSNGHKHLNTYKCLFCESWHLGRYQKDEE